MKTARVRARLIVVEDDALILEMVDFVLGRSYEVLGWTRGPGLVDLIASHLPDALILGVSGRDDDGWALYRALRSDARTEDLPVVLLADPGAERPPEEVHVRPADARITRPFEPRELLSAVHGLLGRAA